MASKRSTPYQMAHGHKYGVRICQRTTDSTQEVLIQELDDAQEKKLLEDTGLLLLHAVEGIQEIQAERNERNEVAEEEIPSVLLHDIVNQRHQDFCSVVRRHRERLLTTWNPVEIDALEQQCQEMCTTVKADNVLKEYLSKHTQNTFFQDSWKILNGRFPLVEKFCGGIATVFPGTSQVESDFSLVKGAKNDQKIALTDLSLEGVLHAKQMKMIENIENSVG